MNLTQGILRVVEQLLASQEELYSLDLVISYLLTPIRDQRSVLFFHAFCQFNGLVSHVTVLAPKIPS
jgi:hypothetical protein